MLLNMSTVYTIIHLVMIKRVRVLCEKDGHKDKISSHLVTTDRYRRYHSMDMWVIYIYYIMTVELKRVE